MVAQVLRPGALYALGLLDFLAPYQLPIATALFAVENMVSFFNFFEFNFCYPVPFLATRCVAMVSGFRVYGDLRPSVRVYGVKT